MLSWVKMINFKYNVSFCFLLISLSVFINEVAKKIIRLRKKFSCLFEDYSHVSKIINQSFFNCACSLEKPVQTDNTWVTNFIVLHNVFRSKYKKNVRKNKYYTRNLDQTYYYRNELRNKTVLFSFWKK